MKLKEWIDKERITTYMFAKRFKKIISRQTIYYAVNGMRVNIKNADLISNATNNEVSFEELRSGIYHNPKKRSCYNGKESK